MSIYDLNNLPFSPTNYFPEIDQDFPLFDNFDDTNSFGLESELGNKIRDIVAENLPVFSSQNTSELETHSLFQRKRPRDDGQEEDSQCKYPCTEEQEEFEKIFLVDEIHPQEPDKSVSIETCSGLSKLSDSEKLELPRMAWVEAMSSEKGLPKKRILHFFHENNQVVIQDSKIIFKLNKFSNFPDHYNPPSPYKWGDWGDSSRRSTNLYVIGRMLEEIKMITNLKNTKLDALVKDMMDPVPKNNTKTCSLTRLIEIQADLRGHNKPLIFAEHHIKPVSHEQTQKNKPLIKANSESFDPILSLYKSNMLTNAQKFELPRNALKAVVFSTEGLSDGEILQYFPENNQVHIVANKMKFVFNGTEHFPDYYRLFKCCNPICSKRENVYVIGKVLERIMMISNLKNEALASLIKEMVDILSGREIDPKHALERLDRIL
ncbi:MAG TPA: hypothetical protein VLE96_03980 [Chlamydiales bacterium]|nr:hypothetical protein [Chlamydiales bacterium]